MTNRATLEALLARVLEGEGPDVILDQDIAIALGWTLKKRGKEKRAWWRDPEGKKRIPPRFSAFPDTTAAAIRAAAKEGKP